MPSSSVKLNPGVNTVKTPVLNEAGISASNMIRFREGLVEKRGGWTNYLTGAAASSAIRNIAAWEDLLGNKYVAIAGDTLLSVISGSVVTDIAPKAFTSNLTGALSTTSALSIVTVVDPTYSVNAGDLVTFTTPVAIGGLLLSGTYPVNGLVNSTTYYLNAGSNATSTVSSGGTVETLATTNGSNVVTVTLANHGQAVGGTVLITPAVTVGGLTVTGFYTVATVPNSSSYTFLVNALATSTASASANGGKIGLIYSIAPTATTTPVGSKIAGRNWCIGNFGQNLVACPAGNSLLVWVPNGPVLRASAIPNSPSFPAGFFIADAQQMIVAYNIAGVSPNQVAWCDAGNYSTWTAAGTNQAGTYRIPTGSGIVGGTTWTGQNLLWTDIDVWSMTYVGYPLVWGFNKISTGCGLISQFAWVKIGSAVLWMSQNEFWIYDGSVRPLDCPVRDDVFGNLGNISKIRGGANSQFNEAMWFFPSASGSGENDTYVCYNIAENVWDTGAMQRTGWLDQSIAGGPLGGDASGFLYQHETSPDANGSAITASFTTGYFSLSEGEDFNFVDWLRPDFKFPNGTGTMSVTVLVTNYSMDAPISFGPYTFTQATEFINVRCRGRFIALQFSSSDLGSAWRIGRAQMRFAPDGRR